MSRKLTGLQVFAFAAALFAVGGLAVGAAAAQEKKPAPAKQEPAKGDVKKDDVKKDEPKKDDGKPAGDLVPIDFKLPKPAFKGTPTQAPPGIVLEPPRKGPRPDFLAPKGVKNVALNKPVTSSDSEPIIGTLKLVTDGNKNAEEGSYVELGPKRQWVQIDLQAKFEIYAIMVYHYHSSARIYHDVVVQVSDDPDFIENVKTLFNNDTDNSSGLGIGTDKAYWETNEGKLVDAKGSVARYVRLYSKGNTADDQNHYTEVEVYGLPAK